MKYVYDIIIEIIRVLRTVKIEEYLSDEKLIAKDIKFWVKIIETCLNPQLFYEI